MNRTCFAGFLASVSRVILDREVGDLMGTTGPLGQKLFTYLRYNAELTPEGLKALGLSGIEPKNVHKLDSVDHIADLQRIGKAIGSMKVKEGHFAMFL